jgi:2-oxoglutarate ferredoxin oxidoreductase subunit alpha
MPWGATKGVAREAYDALRKQGHNVGWAYTMNLNPLPEKLLELLKRKELVIVPELNYQGQWSGLLRWEGVRAESITQYTGMPFKTRELITRLATRLKDMKAPDKHHEKRVTA